MSAALRTRLAPSPTGALHLGNARTFLLTWLWARATGASIVLRIEDIDGPRVKAGAAEQALLDLRWLGLDWDEGPYAQTERLPLYEAALESLRRRDLVYPCVCTRKEIDAAASAPHGPDDDGPRYPGTCRGRFGSAAEATAASARAPAWRFVTPEGDIPFADGFAGPQSFSVFRSQGDFVVAKASGPAYQLAVVVDDAAMHVTDVIRGDDLLPSTPRQLLLYEALGLTPPRFTHLPLVVGSDGKRLAKRHGDTRVATYREAGVPPERVVGLLAAWSGLAPRQETSARALVPGFTLDRLPREKITFGAADDAWLRGP
jgi:glutamyl-tRNA synthetase